MEVSFFESYEIWRSAVVVLIISAATLSFLGVWASLKKVVYVPLALSGVSSFGVILGFFLHDFVHLPINASYSAFICALLAAFYFAHDKSGEAKAEVSAYIISSALVLLIGNFIRQDLHDIKSILFGNAVLIESEQIVYVSIAGCFIMAIFYLLHKKFLFISFDPESAAAAGFSVYWNNVILYGSFALMISISSRAIGSLPVFGLTILPALAALNIAKNMKSAFICSIIFGVFSSFFGYYFSFIWDLPTGSTIVTITGILYIITSSLRFIKR